MGRYPPAPMRRAWPVLLPLVLAALSGCGGGGGNAGKGSNPPFVPSPSLSGKAPKAARDLGFPGFATKNTTRIAGADPVADAAASAQAVFPAQTVDTRPAAVALADARDWRATTAAAVLMSAPVRAPLLLTNGPNDLPTSTADALGALAPTGSAKAGGAQVLRVGSAASADHPHTTSISGTAPFDLAASLDRFVSAAAGKTTDSVLVVSADDPAYGMPAAAWAAKSGDPVLFVTRTTIPPATRAAIARHQRPRIYVLGSPQAVSDATVRDLGRLGTTKRAYDPNTPVTDPVTSAISFAKFHDGTFGWNVTDPGHGFVFANLGRPADAGAAAPLSASGTYGPLLVMPDPRSLPAPVQSYLLDLEPGFTADPVRGVYNRAWIMGDGSAVSVGVQSSIDRLLEIAPVKTKP